MKLIVICNLFSGLSSIFESKKIINKGSPFYFNFIRYLSKYEKYEVYFLQTKLTKQKKFIEKIYVKELNKEIYVVKGVDLFYKFKYGSFINKFIQYILVLKSINIFKKNTVPYIDRDNIILSFILSLFRKKHVVRFLGISNTFSKHLFIKKNIYSKLIKSVFNNKNIIKVLTKDGSYTELCKNYPNSFLMFNGIDEVTNYKKENIEKGLRISYVSRIEKYKGQREFLEAINKLKKYNIKVDLIGDGKDVPYIKDYINNNNLSKKVNLTGRIGQEKIFKYLLTSNLFVSINHLGIYGNTLLEASKASLPCIVLDHEYFEDENKDFFYLIKKEKIIDELVEAIKYFYDRQNLIEYSLKSKEFSNKLLTWEDRIKKELDYIKEFIDE